MEGGDRRAVDGMEHRLQLADAQSLLQTASSGLARIRAAHQSDRRSDCFRLAVW